MGRWGIRESLMLAVGVLLSLSIAYCQGKKAGAIDEKLASNKTQLISQDSVTKLVTRAADSARQSAIRLDSTHSTLRTKVRVVRDSVFVRDTVYVSSDIADLIRAADSTIAAQRRSLALQDTLVASLRRGIALRDTRIALLEKKGNPRISKGMQIGVGYCATQNGNSACLYAGYGWQFRMP